MHGFSGQHEFGPAKVCLLPEVGHRTVIWTDCGGEGNDMMVWEDNGTMDSEAEKYKYTMDKPNFHLSRGEVGTLSLALTQYWMDCRGKAQNKRNKDRASWAVMAADAQMLLERVGRFAQAKGWVEAKIVLVEAPSKKGGK